MIAIPSSRSRSMESIARSGTPWFSRRMPLCRSIASTSVVLPWATWAMIATFRMAGGGMCGDSLRERALEELPDRPPAVLLEEPGAGPGKPRAPDPGLPRIRHLDPPVLGPAEPPVGILVEDEDRLFGEPRELRTPPPPSPAGPVPEDLPDHIDLLPRVDLVPDRLEDLADPGGVRVGPVHQPGDVGETDVPVAEFFAA